MSFGDLRRSIINDIAAIRDGRLEVSRGGVMVGLYKELNNNIQVEINATKMSLATEDRAHKFGRVVSMGRRLIGNDSGQESS
jgi:hypothetical protein